MQSPIDRVAITHPTMSHGVTDKDLLRLSCQKKVLWAPIWGHRAMGGVLRLTTVGSNRVPARNISPTGPALSRQYRNP